MKLDEISTVLTEGRGISHIEDLAIDQFISALRNLDQYQISEKVDGSNLRFGIDNNGFYTSREQFGGSKVYEVEDYPIHFSTTYMKAAHTALESVLPDMQALGFDDGDEIEIEVLFGVLPNVVQYHDEINQIVFLRKTKGNVNVEKIAELLDGRDVNIAVSVPYTIDGRTIEQTTEVQNFVFKKAKDIKIDGVSKETLLKHINKELDQLEEYLRTPSGIAHFTNADVLTLPLNRRPDGVEPGQWKELKDLISNKREHVKKEVYHFDDSTNKNHGYVHRIKDVLLNNFVRKIRSQFGPEIEDGGWIEGVVFRDKATGEQFKLIDKDIFTTVKDFVWNIRNQISDKPRSEANINSFAGELLTGLASSLGHPKLGTMQAKRYLRNYGSTEDEILANLPLNINFQAVKGYWESFLEQKEVDLEEILNIYHEDKGSQSLEINFGDHTKTFHYDGEVDRRTLQGFANMFQQIEEFKHLLQSAKTPQDLVYILAGKQLQTL